MWYSNRGDDSNTRLTFPADLRNVQNPILTFDLWYQIENLWDFGYVMASTNGGTTWDILQSDEMTTENPHFTAYGAGYTGSSGGGNDPAWITEEISLAQYAGQEILLRFEMIYDDAINRPGMFIDRVSLDGALTDNFSDPMTTTDWLAEGWVLTDNRLPQQVWVQAIQQIGDENTVTRWLHTGGTASYPLLLQPNVDSVVVVLAPFAPKTTVPASITLTLE
jgi:bacillopeptidase F (M6 metalloprotease family)